MRTNNEADRAGGTSSAACSRKWVAFLAGGLALVLGSQAVAQSPSGVLGCRFKYNSSGSSAITTTGSLVSCRFTADEDITVDRYAISLIGAVGIPAVVVNLRPDASGKPGPTSLASITQYPGVLGAVTLEGTFGNSVSLTSGSVYHLVFNVTNATTIGTTNSLTLRILTGADFSLTPKTGRPDPMLDRLISANSGATWTGSASQTNGSICPFVLGNAVGQAVGQPYSAAYTTPGVGATGMRGERFIYDGGYGYAVTSIMVRVFKGAGNAADDLRVYLLDQGLSIVSSNVLLTAGFTNTAVANYSVNPVAPLKLTDGGVYTLALESKGSTANSYVLVLPSSPFTNAFAATYQGTNGTAVSGSTLAAMVNNTSTATTAYDIYFGLYTVFKPLPGTMILLK